MWGFIVVMLAGGAAVRFAWQFKGDISKTSLVKIAWSMFEIFAIIGLANM